LIRKLGGAAPKRGLIKGQFVLGEGFNGQSASENVSGKTLP